MDGVHVTSTTNLDAALLMAVSSYISGTEKAAPGAPATTDALNPALTSTAHSGLIVIRSELEVRIDEASLLRVGSPGASVRTTASTQSVAADSEQLPLRMDAPLGLEVGYRPGYENRGKTRKR